MNGKIGENIIVPVNCAQSHLKQLINVTCKNHEDIKQF